LQPGEILVQPRTGFHVASVHSMGVWWLMGRVSRLVLGRPVGQLATP